MLKAFIEPPSAAAATEMLKAFIELSKIKGHAEYAEVATAKLRVAEALRLDLESITAEEWDDMIGGAAPVPPR